MFRQDYARFSIFEGLDESQIGQLTPYLVECQFPPDYIVFEQGQPAENLFILLSGEVNIYYKPYDGPTLTVAHIEPGGVFGWSAALHRDCYTSAAVTMRESLAYRIRGINLQAIRERYPETGQLLLERLAGVIAERLRSTHTQVLGILSQGLDTSANLSQRSSK
jgi:CRP-like cAMP-binding protein